MHSEKLDRKLINHTIVLFQDKAQNDDAYFSFVDEFLDTEGNGMVLLIKLLKCIQNAGCSQTGSMSRTQLQNYKKTLVRIL